METFHKDLCVFFSDLSDSSLEKEYQARIEYNTKYSENGPLLTRDDFLEVFYQEVTTIICNVLLVYSGERLTYYLDCLYCPELVECFRDTLKPHFQCVPFREAGSNFRILFLTENLETIVDLILKYEKNALGHLLEYPYVLMEGELAKGMVGTSIDVTTEEGVTSQLYGFLAPCVIQVDDRTRRYNTILGCYGYHISSTTRT